MSDEMKSREYVAALYDMYQTMQKTRIRANNKVKAHERRVDALADSCLMKSIRASFAAEEAAMAKALAKYAKEDKLGRWAMLTVGIGSINAAGLLAFIDVSLDPTASSLWRFAGLNPNEPPPRSGEKRHWCGRLKTICIGHIGKSFILCKDKPGCVYGQLYVKEKARLVAKNENGGFKDTAAMKLLSHPDTNAFTKKRWKSGRLLDGHIDNMARRYAVKRFLAHFWEVGRRIRGLPVRGPYVIDELGHTHYDPPPNWPMPEDLVDDQKEGAA